MDSWKVFATLMLPFSVRPLARAAVATVASLTASPRLSLIFIWVSS
jgi:hypothetical protein